MTDNRKTTADSVTENIASVAASIAERLTIVDPNSPAYPLCVTVVAAGRDDKAAIVQYQLCAKCTTPGHADGWAQAMVMSRDLLLLVQRMNEDHKLGLGLLPAVLAQHPMLQHYFKNPNAPAPPGPAKPVATKGPTVELQPDGTRRVTDIVEADQGTMTGGVGGGEHTTH